MMNPDMMSGMMKGQMLMAVYQMLLFQGVGAIFSGFIIAKMPFPLADSFRTMLQQGLTLTALDVRYVSSLSWSFLLIYGLSGLYSLVIGDANYMEEMRMSMGMGGAQSGANPPPGQPKDFGKLFKAEKENYQILAHDFALENAEDLLIAKNH